MTEAEFIAMVRRNPMNAAILDRAPALALPDAWLVSGSLFQTAWNVLTDRPVAHGIKDYDLFYFDPDTSWEAEDAAISRVANALADLSADIELRNQARVHIWYAEKFGTPYPPLEKATDGIDRFLAIACKVGISLDGQERVYAPDGLEDIVGLVIRPNNCANFGKAQYEEKAARWKANWPELDLRPA